MDNELEKGREPGEKGSTQGQIMTPMCDENVSNKGGGDIHSYKGVVNTKSAGPSSGDLKTDNAIEGPGVKGNWDTQVKITGNNKKY